MESKRVFFVAHVVFPVPKMDVCLCVFWQGCYLNDDQQDRRAWMKYVRWVKTSIVSHVMGDGHQPNSRVYIPIIWISNEFLLSFRWPFPFQPLSPRHIWVLLGYPQKKTSRFKHPQLTLRIQTPPDRIGLMVETSHPQVIGLIIREIPDS